MNKTLFVTEWPGGGVWALNQLVMAEYFEDQTGVSITDISDLNISSSAGSIISLGLLIPDEKDPSKPKFKPGDLIEPFKDCAAQMFGPDGISSHYTHTVKHDLANLITASPGKIKKGLARFLRNPKVSIHKPHHVLGEFLDRCVGDVPLSALRGSCIVQAHHMENMQRASFTHLKSDVFAPDAWDDDILPNHAENNGDTLLVRDAIMATTAAPTVFNSYAIGDRHYVDFDRHYSALAPLTLALACLRVQPQGFAYTDGITMTSARDVRLLKMTCGTQFNRQWDPVAYADKGPLCMLSEMTMAVAIDQQKQDHAILKQQLGAKNITTLGPELSALDEETETLPSGNAFDGNRSNLTKIEDFARKTAEYQRETMMRYADMAIEIRAKESGIDPLSAFGSIANNNNPDSSFVDQNKTQSGIWPFRLWGKRQPA